MPNLRCLDCGALGNSSRCKRCAAAHEQNRRPSSTQRYGPGWSKVSQRVIARSPRCCMCSTLGTPINPLSVDHIVPVSRGGTSSPDNLRVMCQRCNSAKGARPE